MFPEEERYEILRQGTAHRLGLVITGAGPPAIELLIHLPCIPGQEEEVRFLEELVGQGYRLSFGDDGWITAMKVAVDTDAEISTLRRLMVQAGVE